MSTSTSTTMLVTPPSVPGLPTLRIGWLYGQEMNIYGDRGNVLALSHRARARGYGVTIDAIGIGTSLLRGAHDLYFWGGGQDREQISVSRDLQGDKAEVLREAILDDLPVLAICGGYQLLGHSYHPFEGDDLPGVGVLDMTSEAGNVRYIGNVVIDAGDLGTLVGFENHSGRTYLGADMQPLGTVRVGHGNNGSDGKEGVRFRNVIGCYMHGALLPKNPHLTDWFIARALARSAGLTSLPPLDSAFEQRAHAGVVQRALAQGSRAVSPG